MSLLKKANKAFRNKEYEKAYILYLEVIKKTPRLKKTIEFNLNLSRKLGKLSDEDIGSQEKTNSFNEDKQSKVYEGKVEKFENNQIRGWAVNKNNPKDIFKINVFIDDVLFCSLENNIPRGDLKRHGKSNGLGGYFLVFPNNFFDSNNKTISIRFPDQTLMKSLKIVPHQNTFNNICSKKLSKNISIIVPIYNAADDLKVCIERLVEYTSTTIDIIMIDDASPDEEIQQILASTKKYNNFRIFKNEKNLGFTKTVNRGIELAKGNDVVLLNSDARVTPRWLEGLQSAVATDEKIATVTPMSDRAGAFSAPNIGNENDLPTGVSEIDYAVAFRRRSVGYYPTVPTGNGFCMYIRRKCIDEIGPLDELAFPKGYGEENDFCMRARSHGWKNIIDDRTYVFHDRNKSFGGQKTDLIKSGRKIVDTRYPDYKKAISTFSTSPLINAARFKAKLAVDDCQNQKILPRGLFVVSTLTGGTPQTNRDLMLALSGEVEPWLLHCDSNIVSLYRIYDNKPDELMKQYQLKESIEPLTHTSLEYDRIVMQWILDIDFEFVHIRHLAWHSLSLPKIAHDCGAKVIYSFHDFYAVCPTIKLLDENQIYCNGNCTSTNGECKPELWPKDSFPHLKNNWVFRWREMFNEALKYCDTFVTTHESVRKTIMQHLEIPKDKFYVIAHGRDFNQFYNLSVPYTEGEPLKILIPGNISEPKGSKIILELLKIDKKNKLNFHILGRSNIKINDPRLTFHGEYKREDFAKHVEKIKPHVGGVLSIWNETWCHTLTELWSVGIPVIVTDFETLKNRVETTGAGWVVDHSDVKALYKILIDNVSNQNEIEEKRQNTLKVQNDVLKTYQNNDMALKYLALYAKKSPNKDYE